MAYSLDLERQNLPDWAVLGITTFGSYLLPPPWKGGVGRGGVVDGGVCG